MKDIREETIKQTADARIEALGLDFGEVAKIDSPTEAIPALLSCLGNIFKCERVYVFEKNAQGSYDCTDEWFAASTYSKKHLMQNVQEAGVKYYYNYFLRGKKLLIQDMEAFKQEDYQLYKILEPQGLRSVICGQLIFDHTDIGFVGIDNPSSDRFEELNRIFDVINHFISIQIHRRNLENKIRTKSKPIKDAQQTIRSYSLYDRVAAIRMEEPLALIYCDATLKYEEMSDSEDKTRIYAHTEKVLGNVFGARNVFHLDRSEFLVFFEDNEDTDIAALNHYASLAQSTLDTINIKISMGVSQTMKYQQNFFDLVHKANVKMLQIKKKYRDVYTGKYHFDEEGLTFRDLVEIRPTDNRFYVMYSGYPILCKREGSFDEICEGMKEIIAPKERDRFQKFWEECLKSVSADSETPGVKEDHFTVMYSKRMERVKVWVSSYTDIKGNPVLMCHTK